MEFKSLNKGWQYILLNVWRPYRGKIHHLAFSTFLAITLLFVYKTGVLERIDHFFLLAFQSDKKIQEATLSEIDPSKSEIIVLEIDEKIWELDFQQVSPLRRDLLAKIILSLFDKEHVTNPPRDLIIDLDLSPGTSLLLSDASRAATPDINLCKSEQQSIPDSIEEQFLAQQCLNGVLAKYGKQVIMHLPLTSKYIGEENLKHIQSWQSSLANNGVLFSSAKVELVDSVLLTYNKQQANLAKVAATKRKFISSESEGGFLNFNGFVANAKVVPLVLDESQLVDFGDSKPDLSNKTVFLGLNNSFTDQYSTPVGSVSGVVGHAVNYYSLGEPVLINKYKVWVVIAEILIGFLFALLLERIWHGYIQETISPKGQKWKKSLLYSLIYIAPIICILFLYWLLQNLFEAFIWANPTLFILGLWVKMHIESRTAMKHVLQQLREMSPKQ
ncbi:MAG: hypothetical protein Alis3KO_13180 [Aliiglaciecola sp.]